MIRKNSEHPEVQPGPSQPPIAIIGMAAIFPESRNLEEFWNTILKKIDCITDVPASRWKLEDYYDPDPRTPDKTYCKRGGFIPDIDFDPAEFGLPPNILEATDVSQLLALAVAKEALADAGYSQAGAAILDNTGVILGTVVGQQAMRPLMARLQYPVWGKVLRSAGLPEEAIPPIIEKMKLAYTNWEENSFPGFLSNVIAGRIANRLDLGGINSVVDAACASSLSAVKMAVNELASFNCDMMLTGGVDIDNSILTYMCFSKTPAFSKNEKVAPFDASSDGMMAGEGVGMLVLKRLADAERDGDRIYAVIKGIGASSDGRFKSIYAPRPEGQAKALRGAYHSAGVEPATVGLVEAHGTGTVAGDLCEVTALGQVFGESLSAPEQIALGSVKSQIGHTKAAAGSASLIKTALALYHKILPPTINVTEPNPKLKFDQTPFYLNTQPRPWLRRDPRTPRRAGVSSFGFGGTNFHVILEEYEREPKQPYRMHRTAQIILLEAATLEGLLSRCETTLERLGRGKAAYYNELVETSRTLKIPAASARLGFVAGSMAEAEELLKISIEQLQAGGKAVAWDHPRGIYYRRQALEGKVVALFSGQGSQYLDMGRELALNFPSLREAYSAMDRLFQKDKLAPLSDVVFPPPAFDKTRQAAQQAALQRTDYAQPAIGVFSAWLYRLLQQAGFRPDFIAGHSFGELTALWAAGAVSEADYLTLIKARGQAMAAPNNQANTDPGTMLAVIGGQEGLPEALKKFPEITLANLNSPAQVVLAGAKAAVARAQTYLREKGFNVSELPVAAAFHTSLVGHAQKPFEKVVKATAFHAPRIPVYSNSNARPYPANPAEMQQILAEHLLKPVLFQQQIENIYAEGGNFFIEFGPRDILTNLVKNILGDRPHFALALNPSRQKDSDTQLRRAIVQLRVAGQELGDIDGYQKTLPAPLAVPPGRLNVRLNGSPYISKATREKFEKALQNGNEVKLAMTNSSNKNGPAIPENLAVTPAPAPAPDSPTPVNSAPAPVAQEPLQSVIPVTSSGPENLEARLEQFGQYQSEVLHVHEQYLNNQGEYTRSFFQLMQQQQELLLGGQSQPAPVIVESIERNMHRFHDYQSETLRVHDHYLQQQAAYSAQLFHALSGNTSYRSIPAQPAVLPAYSPPERPPVSRPAPSPAKKAAPVPQPGLGQFVGVAPEPAQVKAPVSASLPLPVVEAPEPPPAVIPPDPAVVGANLAATQTISAEALSRTLLEVVSEKTGYPVEMLELSMDMEADLGIDSIKRVEILGALQDRYPDLPRLSPEELAELRTLGQITGRFGTLTTGPKASPPATPVAFVEVPLAAASVAFTPPAGPGEVPLTTRLTDTLLKVVSEKTGYPVEMIELGMDMEADLGIDSIKRVEILGAMQEINPDLPRLSPEELAELRTLGQITERMSGPAIPVAPGKPNLPVINLTPSEVSGRAVRIKYLPDPDYLEFTPGQRACLLTDDGTALTGQLARELGGEGWRVVVLAFAEARVPVGPALPQGVERIVLSDLAGHRLDQTLKSIVEKYGPIGSFIHLNPPYQPAQPDGWPFGEVEKALVKQVFLLAGHLKKPLHEAAQTGRASFLTVTRLDGELGLGDTNSYGVIAGGLFGLTKSLKQEWEGVFCRAIDLAPELETSQAVRAVLAELHDPNQLLGEVGYNLKGRVTLTEEAPALTGVRQ